MGFTGEISKEKTNILSDPTAAPVDFKPKLTFVKPDKMMGQDSKSKRGASCPGKRR